MARGKKAIGLFNYDNVEKRNKNFMYLNLKSSKCYNCNFSGSNFDYVNFRGAHFKTCSFMNGTFEGAEFIGTNLKNSKFKNAKFKNAIFEGANLDGTDFKDAKFENTIFLGCKLEKTKNFSTDLQGVRVFEGMPEINISLELEESLNSLMENKYVKASRIFDTKEGNINTLTLMILKENFNEEELIKGFNEIKSQIDRDFYTISYVIRLINKVIA